jgi:hypothetical protein
MMILTNLYYTERMLNIETKSGDLTTVCHAYSVGEYRYVRATEAAKILEWVHNGLQSGDTTWYYFAPCENWKMPVIQLRAKHGIPNTVVGKAVNEAIDALKLELSRYLECDEHSHSAETTNKMLQLT